MTIGHSRNAKLYTGELVAQSEGSLCIELENLKSFFSAEVCVRIYWLTGKCGQEWVCQCGHGEIRCDVLEVVGVHLSEMYKVCPSRRIQQGRASTNAEGKAKARKWTKHGRGSAFSTHPLSQDPGRWSF